MQKYCGNRTYTYTNILFNLDELIEFLFLKKFPIKCT